MYNRKLYYYNNLLWLLYKFYCIFLKYCRNVGVITTGNGLKKFGYSFEFVFFSNFFVWYSHRPVSKCNFKNDFRRSSDCIYKRTYVVMVILLLYYTGRKRIIIILFRPKIIVSTLWSSLYNVVIYSRPWRLTALLVLSSSHFLFYCSSLNHPPTHRSEYTNTHTFHFDRILY